MAQHTSIQPFLKWAGGKRWLAARHNALFPSRYRNYVEPFLGGGAVFFHLRPTKARLGDINRDLINVYTSIKNQPKRLWQLLREHDALHNNEYYYVVREQDSNDPLERAARLLYLNRTCWNGLYRVNQAGRFNVPRGTKNTILLPDDNFTEVSRLLSRAEITCGDFESTLEEVRCGDFVFVDPPYTVKHNFNGFIKYNESIFTWPDQVRLMRSVEIAASKGALILITNADHDSIKDLYADLGIKVKLPRHSVLAATSKHRSPTSELAICVNYEPNHVA
jgi:DNA adenine methylase